MVADPQSLCVKGWSFGAIEPLPEATWEPLLSHSFTSPELNPTGFHPQGKMGGFIQPPHKGHVSAKQIALGVVVCDLERG